MLRALALSIAIVALTTTLATAQPTDWTRIEIGTLGGHSSTAHAISDGGMVVGSSTLPGDIVTHAFAWTQGGGLIDLGTLPGHTDSEAWGVNNHGMVVGMSYTPGVSGRAFAWTQARGLIDIGTLPGGLSSAALAVNDAGTVVGYAAVPSSSVGYSHAFVWSEAEGMTDLGTLGGDASSAVLITGTGIAAGTSGVISPGDPTAAHAFVWTRDSGVVDIGTLLGTQGGQSGAAGVNEVGMVVGRSTVGTIHAFIWSKATGMLDLGTMNRDSSYARAVNRAGMVVGSVYDSVRPTGSQVAFSWTPAGGMTGIGAPVDRDSNAVDVNNSGLVVGSVSVPGYALGAPIAWTRARGLIYLDAASDSYSYAVAVNENGSIIGDGEFFDGAQWRHKAIVWVSTERTGWVSVTTNLASAAFTVSGPDAFAGVGTSFSQQDVTTGTYTIVFGQVPGYVTPAPQTQTLVAGGALSFYGRYVTPPPQACLTTAVTPNLAGIVIRSEVGPCYATGATVTLTARPSPGYVFASWSGVSAVTQNPLTLTVQTAQTVTAEFAVDTRLLVFPLRNKSSLSATITSVFDHSTAQSYCPDDVVTAYTGEQGRRAFGVSSLDAGFAHDCNGDGKKDVVHLQAFSKDPHEIDPLFHVNGHYTGGRFLAYDGHPGYDFRTTDQMADGTLCATAVCPTTKGETAAGVALGETAVLAAADGTVVCVNPSSKNDPKTGCGEGPGEVKIRHVDVVGVTYFTVYLHLNLDKKKFQVKPGDRVAAGDQIAVSGTTGAIGQPHLHFEVRSDDGTPLDPYGWSGAQPDPYRRSSHLMWRQP